MPQESSAQFLGNVDSLARFPDAAVIVVFGAANFHAAEGYFTSNPVIGIPSIYLDWNKALGFLRGRKVIVWHDVDSAKCGYGYAVAEYAESAREVVGPEASTLAHAQAVQLLRSPGGTRPIAKATKSPVEAPAQPEPALDRQSVDQPRKPDLGVVEQSGAIRKPKPKDPEPDADLPDGFSQDAIASEFTRQHPGWRYVAGWGKWMAWDKRVWKPDTVLKVFDLVRLVCREQAEVASRFNVSASGLRTLRSANNVAGVERFARAAPTHARPVDVWDAQPLELNTMDGIIDLTSGKRRVADASDYVTKCTAVGVSDAAPEKWLRFLADVTNSDVELIKFLQRMCGYCLTGDVSAHALFFLYGTGANGKSTFIDTICWVLGDYARVAAMDTFTESKNERHPQELASLMGARLVVAQETEEGRKWAESRIKALTGGSPITARFMRQDEFTFMPQFKLVIVGNHKPGLRNVDEAMRRRLHLVPFTVTIPSDRRDANLGAKLRAEGAGILEWMLQGCIEYQRTGLAPPAAVREATDKYMTTQDAMGTWMTECCERVEVTNSGQLTNSTIGDLYKSFSAWCGLNGEYVVSRRRFSDALENRGYEARRYGGLYQVQGLRLKQPAAATNSDYMQD